MGNNQSSSTTKTVGRTPSPASTSPLTPVSAHRSQTRNIIPVHTTHRSAAPPEPSLAEAQGSTTSSSKPWSINSTNVSSISPSPHSSVSASTKLAEPRSIRDEPSKPVDVPCEPSSVRAHNAYADPADLRYPEPHMVSNNSITDAYIRGPPRLPLPIEEEVHTPGSPILGPDEAEGLPDIDLAGDSSDGLTRKGSAVSANTVDDEDAQELRVDRTRPVVPTKIEWKRGGEKVYVTGTIFQWNRKQRLNPVEDKPDCFAAVIYILPGTHHVRFVVDGIMQTSPDLPTTVDFGNNLVNYIEVSPEEAIQQKQSSASVLRPPIPDPAKEQLPKPPRGKAVLPPASYSKEIPQYLLDFDQAEDSPAYQNAVGAIEKLPTPPTLPGFLSKPILNAATLMKDDNSVLNMPNHTVLNHLGTSSIKNNVLAVCATTRYRNKYVTTIIYKPTSSQEG